MREWRLGVLFLVTFLVMAGGAAGVRAGERCDLIFVNSLNEEIVSLRVQYSTPYGEPRNSSSHVFLRPGGMYRIGVQGVILPERILVDLATKTYDFADLSGLNPDEDMRLEVVHEDGGPVLKRADAEGSAAKGVERDYLTGENRVNAVDRDLLTDAKTFDEVRALVVEKAQEERQALGPLRGFDLEAGPIWNHEHALSRCPEVTEEWNQSHDGKARWTGTWTTTVEGEMSVCGCVAGAAELSGTLFEEDGGWGRTLYFPVEWSDWHGVARVQAMDKNNSEEGIGIDIRLPIPGPGADAMLDGLLSDLRVDGYRPLHFQLKTWDEKHGQADESDLDFRESKGDKYDDQDKMQELLSAAYDASTLTEAVAVWVREDTFEKLKAGEEAPGGPGVMTLFSQGTFEAVFIPDMRMCVQ